MGEKISLLNLYLYQMDINQIKLICSKTISQMEYSEFELLDSVRLIIRIEYLDKLKEYNDFTSDWYMDIGYQILITWIVTIVHPCLIMPFVNYLDECLKTWKAKREEVQTKMEKIL